MLPQDKDKKCCGTKEGVCRSQKEYLNADEVYLTLSYYITMVTHLCNMSMGKFQ